MSRYRPPKGAIVQNGVQQRAWCSSDLQCKRGIKMAKYQCLIDTEKLKTLTEN